jgi:hypothetical protein
MDWGISAHLRKLDKLDQRFAPPDFSIGFPPVPGQPARGKSAQVIVKIGVKSSRASREESRTVIM